MAFGGGMGAGCLTSTRLNMFATLLHQDDDHAPDPNPDEYGEWVNSQDPLTGQIVRVWRPFESLPDNPDTPEHDPTFREINCLARGIVDGGIRVAGTTERFGEFYENVDFVRLWVPADVLITKRDRVTNIKDASGQIRWLDEETLDGTRATVFNVNGVAPLFNAFNIMIEQYVLLERVESSYD